MHRGWLIKIVIDEMYWTIHYKIDLLSQTKTLERISINKGHCYIHVNIVLLIRLFGYLHLRNQTYQSYKRNYIFVWFTGFNFQTISSCDNIIKFLNMTSWPDKSFTQKWISLLFRKFIPQIYEFKLFYFLNIGSKLTIIYTNYANAFEMRLIAKNSKATCLWVNTLSVSRREENKLPFL